MEAFARPPDPLTNDGDLASNWKSWKESFIIFMKVSGCISEPNDKRANFFKNCIGKIGIEAIQKISFDNEEDKDDMDILIVKLEEFFNPPKNELVERYEFFKTSKKANESIEQHINVLKEKAKTCNFNDMTNSLIVTKIVCDTSDKILRKKFFEADNLNLTKLIAIYNDYNINTEKMKQITENNEKKQQPANFSQMAPRPQYIQKPCWRCDKKHPLRQCPAWGSKCTKCNNLHHFTHCCKDFLVNDNKKHDKWNNEVHSKVKTMDLTNKKISLPDVPILRTANSVVNNTATSTSANFGKVPASNINSKLCYNNTNYNDTSRLAYLSKSTPYNYSYGKTDKPEETVTNLYNRDKNDQIKQMVNEASEGCKWWSNVKKFFTGCCKF
ncbi:uncharacterized protein [Cardiocondyla obscurior]|uniref:uncharacterized protein isoform X2 n=1 Tax=Cardiocondyla obscurior TaxID=286306 RepID=UPI00396562E3